MADQDLELTPRQQTILRLVVHSYVATAQPVSSKSLIGKGMLNVSSATIRNEMAVLEEMGYLTHPHTSAGRVPTDKGYRYFVEHLLGDVELSNEEQNTIRHQFHQAKLEMSQWMQLASAVLARATHSAALVTAPRIETPRVRHLTLISTQAHLVLLVLVFQGGTVRQRMLMLREPMDQMALNQAANKLNTLYAGADAHTIETHAVELTDFESEVVDLVLELMRDDAPAQSEVYRDGLTEVLQEPEFVSQEGARALVNALEQPEFLNTALGARVGTVQVVIGGEGRWRELSACSAVLARYGVEGFASGMLGVLGPMRMPYGRAISAVRYVADLMSNLVSDLYSR
ncbi:MAG: heat-inducible transcriptional repressor HrcA [Anaerolineae bacterium]